MEESGLISGYAALLAGKLGYDRALSQRVRKEVEDHLREAVAADATSDPHEAEQRAIAKFGDPGVIAAQFSLASIAGEIRKVALTVILVVAGVFLAMAARLAWYDLTQWGVCESTRALGETVGLIDRSAFWLASLGGLVSWAYIRRHAAQAAFDPACRRRLGFFFLLCALAAGGLVASVICDGVLTVLRLSGWDFSVDFVIPILSMTIEFACAVILVVKIRSTMQRTESAAASVR